MMRVYFRNAKDNKHICLEEFRFAARFMYLLLVSEREHDKTTLHVNFSSLKRTLHGAAISIGDEKYPKKFAIVINHKLKRKGQLLTLAHELVHCKQYSRSQLRHVFDRKIKDYRLQFETKVYNEERVSYWDLPWEVEAHGREYGLYHRYEHFRKQYGLFPQRKTPTLRKRRGPSGQLRHGRGKSRG